MASFACVNPSLKSIWKGCHRHKRTCTHVLAQNPKRTHLEQSQSQRTLALHLFLEAHYVCKTFKIHIEWCLVSDWPFFPPLSPLNKKDDMKPVKETCIQCCSGFWADLAHQLGCAGCGKVDLRGVRWNEGGWAWGFSVLCPPNGSILLKCEACSFLTCRNKSISCVRVSLCMHQAPMCFMHEEKIGGI